MPTLELPNETIPHDFLPFAEFDVHLDCIRVLTRDTSVCEVRMGEDLTILRDNFPLPGGSQYVGFAIKGVNHLLNDLGFDLKETYSVADIVDAIVRHRPASTMAVVLDLIKDRIDDLNEFTVDLSTLECEPA